MATKNQEDDKTKGPAKDDGDQGKGPDPGLNNDDGKGPDSKSGDEPTYTAADLQRAATKESKAAAAKAKRDLAEQFGVTIDEAEAIIKAHKKAEEDRKDVVDKAKEDAAAATSEAEAAKSETRTAKLEAGIVRKLMTDTGEDGKQPTMNPDSEKAAMILAMNAAESSEAEDLDEIVAEAVKFVREEAPQFFGGKQSDQDGGRKSGTPQTPTRPANEQGTGPKSEIALGGELYDEMMKSERDRSAFLPKSES